MASRDRKMNIGIGPSRRPNALWRAVCVTCERRADGCGGVVVVVGTSEHSRSRTSFSFGECHPWVRRGRKQAQRGLPPLLLCCEGTRVRKQYAWNGPADILRRGQHDNGVERAIQVMAIRSEARGAAQPPANERSPAMLICSIQTASARPQATVSSFTGTFRLALDRSCGRCVSQPQLWDQGSQGTGRLRQPWVGSFPITSWARHWDRGRWWDRESRTDTGCRPTAAKRR